MRHILNFKTLLLKDGLKLHLLHLKKFLVQCSEWTGLVSSDACLSKLTCYTQLIC